MISKSPDEKVFELSSRIIIVLSLDVGISFTETTLNVMVRSAEL